MTFAQCMLIAAGGTLAYELVRLYELMGKLPAARFKRLITAPWYWPVTLGLVLGSAFISWSINANGNPSAWQLVVAAIGARSLVIKPLVVSFSARSATLGGPPAPGGEARTAPPVRDESTSVLRDMLV